MILLWFSIPLIIFDHTFHKDFGLSAPAQPMAVDPNSWAVTAFSGEKNWRFVWGEIYPICSMVLEIAGIFTYMCVIIGVNVCKHSIHETHMYGLVLYRSENGPKQFLLS